MIYFIAEDSNSGWTFWTKVLGTFADNWIEVNTNIKGNVVYGNISMVDKVQVALSKAKHGDSIFLAFYNITPVMSNTSGKISGFNAVNFLRETNNRCKQKGINLLYTNYYSFEEVYCSYIELERLCRVSKRIAKIKKDNRVVDIAKILRYVRENIDNDTEYYLNNQYIQDIIDLDQEAAKNKEHFLNALLRIATSLIDNNMFKISKKKGKFSGCWIKTCQEYRETSINRRKNEIKRQDEIHKFENACVICKYKFKDKTDIEKLIDLNNNSILNKASLKFIDIKNL